MQLLGEDISTFSSDSFENVTWTKVFGVKLCELYYCRVWTEREGE